MVIQAIDIKNKYKVYNATSYEASLGELVQLAAKHLNKNINLINASRLMDFYGNHLKW